MQIKDVRPEDLANAMGLSVAKAWSLANNMDACFKPTRMQWTGKKHRPVDALYRFPKQVLRRLHRFLQSLKLFHRAAHGGVSGRSTFTSAKRHLGQNYILKRDAADCYPSITPEALVKELLALGFRRDSALLLSRLFTSQGRIPQGSPVSGDAVNFFFYRIDNVMSSLCGTLGFRYTRVADDFVFSADKQSNAEIVIGRLESELAARGIRFNVKKIRQEGFQGPSEQRTVHNISVSRKSGTAIVKGQQKEARELVDKYLAAAKSVCPASIQAVAYLRSRAMGWYYYCNQAQYSPTQSIRQKIKAGDRRVLATLRKNNLSCHKNMWWLVDTKSGKDIPRQLSVEWNQRLLKQAQPATTC